MSQHEPTTPKASRPAVRAALCRAEKPAGISSTSAAGTTFGSCTDTSRYEKSFAPSGEFGSSHAAAAKAPLTSSHEESPMRKSASSSSGDDIGGQQTSWNLFDTAL